MISVELFDCNSGPGGPENRYSCENPSKQELVRSPLDLEIALQRRFQRRFSALELLSSAEDASKRRVTQSAISLRKIVDSRQDIFAVS